MPEGLRHGNDPIVALDPYQFAVDVLGTGAAEWWTQPNEQLGGESPINVAARTEAERERVRDIVRRVVHIGVS